MAVTLPTAALAPFPRFTLYNSPYVAHDHGCAVDLYPGTERAPSPVAGTVARIETVRAPAKPYAEAEDHLIVVDTGEHLARLLHVDPAVAVGDEVARGEDLGRLVRAGFFAPWVDNHVHLGFRAREADPLRASGSLPLAVEAEIAGLAWDGTGTVVETGDTYALLDEPSHPDPGAYYVGIAADGRPPGSPTAPDSDSPTAPDSDPPVDPGSDVAVVDGGLPHYDGGGLLVNGGSPGAGPVSLLGQPIGDASGRDVAWRDVTVRVDGTPITGLSCFLARDGGFGAKLICPDTPLAVGTDVTVSVTVADPH